MTLRHVILQDKTTLEHIFMLQSETLAFTSVKMVC